MNLDEISEIVKEVDASSFDTKIAATLTNLIRSHQLHIMATMGDSGSDEWQAKMAASVDSLERSTDKLIEALDILVSRTDGTGLCWREAKNALDSKN